MVCTCKLNAVTGLGRLYYTLILTLQTWPIAHIQPGFQRGRDQTEVESFAPAPAFSARGLHAGLESLFLPPCVSVQAAAAAILDDWGVLRVP